ncbi:MAG: hypothetical protein IKR26_06960 [Lachnospiraceae bacterium]|nr:hypothetical protein [Lachnospiraceae bacterium]
MKISEIKNLLDAETLCCDEELGLEVESAFCCDMMSDVLAFASSHSVLITGLLNPQVVRTAMMLDMKCIVFVCGKSPTPEIVSLARENGIVVLVTGHYMFAASGLLYNSGKLSGA